MKKDKRLEYIDIEGLLYDYTEFLADCNYIDDDWWQEPKETNCIDVFLNEQKKYNINKIKWNNLEPDHNGYILEEVINDDFLLYFKISQHGTGRHLRYSLYSVDKITSIGFPKITGIKNLSNLILIANIIRSEY